MNNSKNIVIHQTLHGYKEGHTLLGSSIELSNVEKRDLLILTDYSGSGKENKFSDYVSAYPIKSSKFYAFTKTWYAEEMPRPGCVWSHTLLIELTSLSAINNPKELLSLFKRPAFPEVSEYNLPFEVVFSNDVPEEIELTDDFYTISCFLYSSDKPLIVLADNSISYELDFFNIWMYQWPRLKRIFSFSTGAILPRKLSNEASFDLQVMPYKRESSLNIREKGKFEIVDLQNQSCGEQWLGVYKTLSLSSWWTFLNKEGNDIKPEKTSFVPLVKAALLLPKINTKSAEVLTFLSTYFQEPDNARQLKLTLFNSVWKSDPLKRVDLLSVLLTDKTFDGIVWNFSLLFKEIENGGSLSKDEFKILLGQLNSKMAKVELGLILSSIDPSKWIEEIGIYSSAIDSLLENSPDFYLNEIIWNCGIEVQRTWMNRLIADPMTNWKELIPVLLTSHNVHFVQEIYAALKTDVIKIIIQWIEQNNQFPAADWQYLLTQNLPETFDALIRYRKFNVCLLTIIPNTVSPTSHDWKGVKQDVLQKFIEISKSSNLIIELTGVYTYFITTILSGTIGPSIQLLTQVFQPLHDNLHKNQCEPRTWQRFHSTVAKELLDLIELDFFNMWWKDRFAIPEWDKCEFLRRALINHVRRYDLDPIVFAEVVTDKDTFRAIVRFCIEIKPLKRLMKEFEKRLEVNKFTQSFHYKVLSKEL